MKRFAWVVALWCGMATAQQADITGTQLLSGDSDAKLQQLAREAAGAKKKLIITAPQYWHEMILEQLRRGGGDNLEVEVRDSFAETVLVRSDAAAAAPPVAPAPVEAPAPPPVATPVRPPPVAQTPRPAPTPAPSRPVTPTPAPAVTRAPTTPPPAPRVSAPPPPPVVAQEPVTRPTAPAPAPAPAPAAAPPVAAAPAPAPAPTTPEPAATADADTGASGTTAQAEEATIRRSFEQNLNGGRRITRTLTQTQLEAGDVVYARGPVRAILRRDSLRNDVFWLDGDLELMRVELKELTSNRYQVMERIRSSDNVRLRAVRSEEQAEFDANDPARHADERKSMERRYNGGNTITAKLAPTELQQKDIVYIGDDLVVVVRVTGLDLTRYWLIGRINLGRTELIKDGTNKYKVLQDLH